MIQALTNLIGNAIKFTRENGHVTVCAQQQGEDLAIRVSDTGIGIPKEALPKIFEQFYRVHQPNQQIKGTGLGLSIIKKIVEAHRGRTEAESEVDKGTTFTVLLPSSNETGPEVLTKKTGKLLENAVVDD
jgi:signal transduction histidine kinase